MPYPFCRKQKPLWAEEKGMDRLYWDLAASELQDATWKAACGQCRGAADCVLRAIDYLKQRSSRVALQDELQEQPSIN